MVRSSTQRLGWRRSFATSPDRIASWRSRCRSSPAGRMPPRAFFPESTGPPIGAVGEQLPEKGKQIEQGRQQRETASLPLPASKRCRGLHMPATVRSLAMALQAGPARVNSVACAGVDDESIALPCRSTARRASDALECRLKMPRVIFQKSTIPLMALRSSEFAGSALITDMIGSDTSHSYVHQSFLAKLSDSSLPVEAYDR